ncbi:MAG: tetratricopeptide repeat protein, partial [Methanothrix sp.]|nr:tetratricopeptide repeat protein [Methanothrix sp.]
HFVASAVEGGKSVAFNSFELRSDELRIIERLREMEKAAVKPESLVTFHEDFGQELYGKVLAGDLKSYFQKQLKANGEGLRISLQFDDDAQWLATLPWEFLHDGEDFLVARRNTLLSRMPSGMKKVQSAPVESVLRMLVIISAPQGKSCAPLDTEKERDRILQAVDRLYVQRKMEVDFTDDATFETIQSYLNEKDYQLVHFTGHGTEIEGQGFLVLENEDLTARQVDNQAIADLFAERGIRLVVLSACESADLADKLVRKGVPAVVAMQYSILDPSATGFAFAFYQALVSGRAIDQSLTEARLAMRNAKGSNKVDFATPVLYLLDPECLHTGKIKPSSSELFQKPVMLGEVQVMMDGFVGRQKELRILQKAFLSGVKRAAIIYGWGGIGKTVLASRLALRMTRHFEGFYGHKCHAQTRPEDILNGLCAFLNMAGISALNQVLYSPAPLHVKTAALVSILNQKRFLIILDNFESCLDASRTKIADPELRQFVEHLLNATASNTKYIITTRYDFDPLQGRLMGAIERRSVPEMPEYQAMWLMNSHSNLAGLDFERKKQIYKAIGGHPWTIGMFAHHASTATVDGLLLELGPLEQELKEFTLFDKSYSELDEAARELLRRASVFEEAVPIEALRWMMGDENEPSPPVDMPLNVLLRWGLVARQEEREETMYSVHTKVRDFVGREDGLDHRKLQVRAAQYYERRAKARSNLWDLLHARDYYYQAEEWETAANIVIGVWEYLARCGYIELAMGLLKQSVDMASVTTKAIATGNLAILYQGVGDLKTAIRLLEEAKEVLNKQGDRRNVAAILHQLGVIHQKQGNYPEAVKLYEQSLDLAKDLGDKSGIALSLHQLGNVHYQQGNYPEAVKLYEQSLEIFGSSPF